MRRIYREYRQEWRGGHVMELLLLVCIQSLVPRSGHQLLGRPALERNRLGSASCSSDSRDDGDEEGQGAGEVGKSDHEEMVECAGMVLLQSYRAIGRVGELFEILRKLNLGVSELPLILLETGACLQISDGACPVARAALEEFLAVRSTCLLDEKYAEVVELYAVKVLVKGFQEIDSAMGWVERAKLTDDR